MYKIFMWVIIIAIVLLSIVSGYKKFFGGEPSQLSTKINNNAANSNNSNAYIASVEKEQRMCPSADKLVKNNNNWETEDHNWRSFSPTISSKILSFLGAQWVGVIIGKVICLYQTDEAVSFPLALEQVNIESALEPRDGGWSALVDKHKFCKSTNVADCAYFVEKPKNVSDVYEEIGYRPNLNK